MGGLGNQLFQAGFGLLMQRLHPSSKLRFNTAYFRRDSRHGGAVVHAIINELQKLYITLEGNGDEAILINTSGFPSAYLPWLVSAKPPIRFNGYFQNWRYILPVLSEIKDSSLLSKLITVDTRYRSILDNANEYSLGIHIRRGDYLQPGVRRHIGLVDTDSMIAISEKIIASQSAANKNCTAFIVSDMPHEDLSELRLSCKTIVVSHGQVGKVSEDLLQFSVLSQCNGLVCSNSTFGYWAGLLGRPYMESSMFLPENWALKAHIYTSDLLAPSMRTYPNKLI